MLSVLTFKASLFAGVLDGGESTVFLGGSRLTRFMEAVEKTTTAITGPVVDERDSAPTATVAETPSRPADPTPDPWVAIAQTALVLLEEVAAASRPSRSGPARDGLRLVQRDPDTGQEYLRIPLPSAELVDRALDAVGQLLQRIRP